jgi:hypothetical protein
VTFPPPVLAVDNFRQEPDAGGTRVSADIGDVPVWFRFPPGVDVAERGDPWLAIAIVPAMFLGAELDLRALPPVSPMLLGALDRIQDIWACWNPLLRRVAVHANTGPAGPSGRGALAFFSGGIDGLFTAHRTRGVLQQLVFINGFDFLMPPRSLADALERVGHPARHLGLPITTVETNWMDLGRHHRLSRGVLHGGCLEAVAHWMAPSQAFVASSSSYAYLYPSGTHPLLDPLFSTEATAIVHHGSAHPRPEKVAILAAEPALLQHAWVCFDDPLRNCGRCAKCLRTRVALRLAGCDVVPFVDAGGNPVERYARIVRSGVDLEFADELVLYAESIGKDATTKPLRSALRRARARRALRDLVRRPRAGRAAPAWDAEAYDLHSWGPGPSPDW